MWLFKTKRSPADQIEDLYTKLGILCSAYAKCQGEYAGLVRVVNGIGRISIKESQRLVELMGLLQEYPVKIEHLKARIKRMELRQKEGS